MKKILQKIQCRDKKSGKIGSFYSDKDGNALSPVFKNLVKLFDWEERIYLDWANNFLTIESFSEHYNLPVFFSKILINKKRVENGLLAK